MTNARELLTEASPLRLVRAVTIELAGGLLRIPLESRWMRRAWRAAYKRLRAA
jgi:hypothetical protein